jgi:hypothetical protein
LVRGKLKPLVKARSALRLVQQRSWRLSHALEEAIFRSAEVLSEGGVRGAGSGSAASTTASTYFGSTMISVDLTKLGAFARGLETADAHAALLSAADGSVRVRLRAMRMARAEAARRVQRRTFGTVLCEIRMRLRGEHLLIDVDLEVPLRVSSRAAGPGRV